MNPTLLIGSLAGVLGLAAAAWLLGLGGSRIGDEAEAMRAAEDSDAGFVAARAVRSDDGQTAVVMGADGSVMLLKVHGARIAARHLDRPLAAEREGGSLRIASGDRRFGDIRLASGDDAMMRALMTTLGARAGG